MMNAGPRLGLKVEMLREINNKQLWYCSNPLITGVSREQESRAPVVDLQLNELKKKPEQWKNKEVYEAFIVSWVLRDVSGAAPFTLLCNFHLYLAEL